MNANLTVTQPKARVNGWKRLWIVATVCWCLFIVIQFGIYLTKTSAYSSEPFSWGSWNQYNSAIKEAEDPRCFEILAMGADKIHWFKDDARNRICRNLRYRLTGIEKYPVMPEQAQDALIQTRNMQAYVIDPSICAGILLLPPALVYLFGVGIAWVRRGFQ
jgi:hypothetical protein